MTVQRPWLILGFLACLPVLLAVKCEDYDPAFGGGAEKSSSGNTPSSGDGGSSNGLRPAVPCSNEGEAHILVENFTFNLACGCVEAEGSECTVPVGTTVIWTFADAEAHNVTSVADTFGGSKDKLSGSFSTKIDKPGDYPYGCTIHAEMRGFNVVGK